MDTSFWDTLSKPWQEAVSEAWGAYCEGTFPIGAVIADADDQIVARGRNAIMAQTSREPLSQHFMAHAEANAYIKLGRNIRPSTPLDAFTLYTTLEPCAMCAGITAISGIKRVDFLLPDPFGGASDLLHLSSRLQRLNVTFNGPIHGPLGNIMTAIFIVTQIRMGITLPPDDVIAPTGFLPGFLLGQQLARDRTLDDFSSNHILASVVFNALAERLH